MTAPPLCNVMVPAAVLKPVIAGWKPSVVAPTAPIVKPFVSVKAMLPDVVWAASVVTSFKGCESVMPVPADRPAVLAVTVPAV